MNHLKHLKHLTSKHKGKLKYSFINKPLNNYESIKIK